MMKRLVFILCLGIFFFSCKKEYSYEGGVQIDPDPTYYIEAVIDGVLTKFRFSTVAKKSSSNGENTLTFIGYLSSSSTDLRGISLTIHYTDVSPASQTIYTEDYQGFDYYLDALYNPDNSTTTIYTAGYGYPFTTIPLYLAINQLTNTFVTGTFSGNFYLSDVDGNGNIEEIHDTPITITGGKFNLPIQ